MNAGSKGQRGRKEQCRRTACFKLFHVCVCTLVDPRVSNPCIPTSGCVARLPHLRLSLRHTPGRSNDSSRDTRWSLVRRREEYNATGFRNFCASCIFVGFRWGEPPRLYRDSASVPRRSAPSWRSARWVKVGTTSRDGMSSSGYVNFFETFYCYSFS